MPLSPIAAIILQYGHWQKTVTCVESLLASTAIPSWIIVVDNASPGQAAARIEDFLHNRQKEAQNAFALPKLILLKQAFNSGYAAGNNAGIRLALDLGAQAFLIINNDVRVEAGALKAMWNRLQQLAHPGICGPLLVYQRPGLPVQCCAGGYTNYITGLSTFTGSNLSVAQAQEQESPIIEARLNFICGACQLVSRKFIEQVGLMDEGYFLYCEEQDWALRASGKFDFGYARDALVYHEEGASTGWSRFSFRLRPSLSMFRSRLRLAWLHHPWFVPTVAAGCVYAAFRLGARKLATALLSRL